MTDYFLQWYESLSPAEQRDTDAAMLKMAADMLGWSMARVWAGALALQEQDRVDEIAGELLAEVNI